MIGLYNSSPTFANDLRSAGATLESGGGLYPPSLARRSKAVIQLVQCHEIERGLMQVDREYLAGMLYSTRGSF
ncbi:hypothetical protein NG895_23460 [Aeoliella sp. ICT_H6.2]|uniref:Uncharacterized protein n=1 Tax=Aeoliella straminimaris TaxID=2954799 RepID=A0A9X2FET3_9BACT|nr:hypothetical protein [Aeoliella straminimaris]MCO6046868.1 hypothetical protein [Aeoliella straminimaris]